MGPDDDEQTLLQFTSKLTHINCGAASHLPPRFLASTLLSPPLTPTGAAPSAHAGWHPHAAGPPRHRHLAASGGRCCGGPGFGE